LKITVDMFKLLCDASGIDCSFATFILGMGKKLQPKDEHYMNSYTKFYRLRHDSSGERLQGESFTLCYNVRYFERHRRGLKDPWSCRQSAIHQKYYIDKKLSNVTIVQPPIRMDGVLQSLTMHLDSHPLEFHCHYITSAIQSWKEYLDYMSSELLALDQAASVPKAFIEFDVDFSVAQQLQSIRRKLIHAEAILGGMQALMAAIMDHARKLWELGGVSRPAHHTFLCEVEGIGGEIRSHSTTARELVAQSGDIQSMVRTSPSGILFFFRSCPPRRCTLTVLVDQ